MHSNTAKDRIKDKLRREAGTFIEDALADERAIEILLNPDGWLWIERLGEPMIKATQIEPSAAENLISTVASYQGGVINRDSPILECEFPLDGSRFEAILPPVSEAPSFSIRKRAIRAHSLIDYVADGSLTSKQCDCLMEAILNRSNILVVGGTGSGKTTLTNALIEAMVDLTPEHRLVILEDTREIQCQAENAVQLRTSETKTMNCLLRATLRLRPDRIIVGEVRGGEALSLLKAWNTGHPGGIATLHANNAHGGLVRLEQLALEATAAPMQKLIAEAIDLVVVISKVQGGRKITEIAAVEGYSGENYILKQR